MEERPFSLLLNLAKTQATEVQAREGKAAFADAMQAMGIGSVFDILRRSKSAFVRELFELSDADGDLAYENARCYATQIVRMYRNQLISSGRTPTSTRRTGVRSLVDIGPSFPNLFKENWDQFCKVGAIEAKDSPVAYLTSLYRFAAHELEGSTPDSSRIDLNLRRPDLKGLLVDQQSTFTQVPMLTIVNDVLGKAIKSYVDTVPDDKDKTLYELVAEKQHPFLFPYNFHHQQVLLGLGGKKPMLGEISYRVSLEVPFTSSQGHLYGQVQHPISVAQVMMSGLSPQQQNLLTEAGPDAGDESIARFFTEKYGTGYQSAEAPIALDRLKLFMEKTGLKADDVQALLAVRTYAPRASPNASPAMFQENTEPKDSGSSYAVSPGLYGARYVNALSSGTTLNIADDANGQQLLNTSVDRFDRMQRMIRLQQWTALTFPEVDTLIAGVSSAANNATGLLNTNTLRALGTYRYLHRRHGLAAEDFSALVYQISVHDNTGHPAMFDRIFNSPTLFDTPLVLDTGTFYSTVMADSKTIAQLCAGLQLDATQESAILVCNIVFIHISDQHYTLTRRLNVISAIYRLARIASMLDLSVKDSCGLIDLLGGPAYERIIVRGTVSPHADDPQNDIEVARDLLDILMELDWAADWLKETGNDVTTVRRQLGIDKTEPAAPQTLLDQLNQLARDAREVLLTEQQVWALNLPDDKDGQPIEWWPLLQPLIDSQGLVTAMPLTLTENLEADLAQIIGTQLRDIEFGDETFRATTVTRLMEFVLRGYLAQRRLMEGLLQSAGGLPLDRCEGVMRWAGSSTDQFLGELLAATANTELYLPASGAATLDLIDTLNRLLRHAEVNQRLALSAQALRTFLVNPQWLHASLSGSLTLSLASFYELDRYRDWRDHTAYAEESLLSYFIQANTSAPAADCATLLAPLIGWSAAQVEAAAQLLPQQTAKSMGQVDWLRRMHSTCQQTGLGSAALMQVTALTVQSEDDDWQAVGEAVMAASH